MNETEEQPTDGAIDRITQDVTAGPVEDPVVTPAEDSAENTAETHEAVPRTMSPLAIGIGPQAVTTGCEYADAGTGTYASTLCWLDLSVITTEYQQQKHRHVQLPQIWKLLHLHCDNHVGE